MLRKLFLSSALLCSGIIEASAVPERNIALSPDAIHGTMSSKSARAVKGFSVAPGAKWQIVLSQLINPKTALIPSDASVWDVDLFNTPATTIQWLKSQGKTVVCYFSAGTWEPNRPDTSTITKQDRGARVAGWPEEFWLNVKSINVIKVMQSRIALAASKGCDAVDPDNTDAYNNQKGGGFKPALTQADAISFFKTLAATANSYGLAIGLKNSLEIINSVSSVIQFAVNEQCQIYNECQLYSDLLKSGKPVLHIEYSTANRALASSCLTGSWMENSMSTIIKKNILDSWVKYCDGSSYQTSVY